MIVVFLSLRVIHEQKFLKKNKYSLITSCLPMTSYGILGLLRRHAQDSPFDHGTPSRPQPRVPFGRVQRGMERVLDWYHWKSLSVWNSRTMFTNHWNINCFISKRCKFDRGGSSYRILKLVLDRRGHKENWWPGRKMTYSRVFPASHVVPKVSCPPMLYISLHWRMFLASETRSLWVASSVSICPIPAMSALQGIWPHS